MEGFNKVKGKRTKRQWHHPMPQVAPSVLSTEEEKDLVNCLLLLARGGYNPKPDKKEEAAADVNITSDQSLAVPTTSSKAGNNVHQCRDCLKCFRSHQALGGHRASHNKKRKLSISQPSEVNNVNSSNNSFCSPPSNHEKIHRCTICGKEFNLGQALGGHMRKHYVRKEKKNSKIFDLDFNPPPPCDHYLDLNLPPPCDDYLDLNLPPPCDD